VELLNVLDIGLISFEITAPQASQTTRFDFLCNFCSGIILAMNIRY